MRHQISGLYAQAQFGGATLVLNVYDNCDFGTTGCVADRQQVDVYGPDYTHNSEVVWLGDKAAADPRISTITTVSGDATYIFGNVGEYSYWPKRNPARPKKPLNLSGDCVEFSTPELTRTGNVTSVLGYRAIEFSNGAGVAGGTQAVVYYLPELGCVSYNARYHNADHKVTMVPVRFTPGFDAAKLALRPAGFVEKAPSQTEQDSSARSLALQGYTQAQIDQAWQTFTMHGDKALADQRWRELNHMPQP